LQMRVTNYVAEEVPDAPEVPPAFEWEHTGNKIGPGIITFLVKLPLILPFALRL
jgi:hypothetical protein